MRIRELSPDKLLSLPLCLQEESTAVPRPNKLLSGALQRAQRQRVLAILKKVHAITNKIL